MQALNPYRLRSEALDRKLEPYELGRVLFHINQRRGDLQADEKLLNIVYYHFHKNGRTEPVTLSDLSVSFRTLRLVPYEKMESEGYGYLLTLFD